MDFDNKKYYIMSLVFVGDYAPLMFQPLWFVNNDIIKQTEYESIENINKDKCLVSDTITFFETDNLSFRIDRTRFQIIAKKKPFELGIDTFEKIVEVFTSFPVKAFGINFSFHIQLDDANDMEKLGKKIAPRDYWEELFTNNCDTDLVKSGLGSITFNKVEEFGALNVTMETSQRIKNGVFFNYNFHFSGNDGNLYEVEDVKNLVKEKYTLFENRTSLITKNAIETALKKD